MKRTVWVGFNLEDDNIEDDEFYEGYTDYMHIEDLLETEGLFNLITEEDCWLVAVTKQCVEEKRENEGD